MPGYVGKALQHFQHIAPTQPQHTLHPWIPPQYGAKVQLTNPINTMQHIKKLQTKYLQQIIGILLYYGRAFDLTMLIMLGSLAVAQSEGTLATLDACSTTPQLCSNAPTCHHMLHSKWHDPQDSL